MAITRAEAEDYYGDVLLKCESEDVLPTDVFDGKPINVNDYAFELDTGKLKYLASDRTWKYVGWRV